MKPSIKYQIIFKHKNKYSINSMCKLFEVSRSGYYAFLKRMDIPDRDLPLAEKIRECQEKTHRTYGYRRVNIWLERQGIYRNSKTVLRVMQKYNLLSVVRRKKFKYVSDHLHKYPNLLNREFTAEYINFYNNYRIQTKTKLTPLEKRNQFVA